MLAEPWHQPAWSVVCAASSPVFAALGFPPQCNCSKDCGTRSARGGHLVTVSGLVGPGPGHMLSSAIVVQHLVVVRRPLTASLISRSTKRACQHLFSDVATEVRCVRISINTFKHVFSAVERKLCGRMHMLRKKAQDHNLFHMEYFHVSHLKTRHNH
jgi:hypothetical protein